GWANSSILERQFQRAKLFAENARIEVLGFSPPSIELARIPAGDKDSAQQRATALHYLLHQQEWIDTVRQVYGDAVADLASAATKIVVSVYIYGYDFPELNMRPAICIALKRAAIPTAVWATINDTSVPFETYKKNAFETQKNIIAFLESDQKSDS